MPEIDQLTVRGFRSLRDVSVELRNVNVLIGANGSGKSNFIQVFSLLQALVNRGLPEYVARSGGADRLLHFGRKETDAIEMVLSFEEARRNFKIRLEATAQDDLFVSRSSVGMQVGSAPARERLNRCRLYHFHDTSESSPMKKTGDIHDNRLLRHDGSNLAAFLYFLGERHPDRYELIRQAVRQVAPFFDDFRLDPLQLNEDKIRLEWRHKGSDAYFDAGSLSDGTLRFMALATLFLQPESLLPSVILVDEPEIGLHPYAITMLSSLIQQAAVDTQVIVSTQSSLLLDHFEPEDVLVAERRDQATELRRLDAERLSSWLEEYSLGQLWEKNELGGRPGGE